MSKYSIDKLKNMNITELYEVSDSIRKDIIEAVSKNGGHLSSNLGIVELTVALHKVFDSPKDKIIFDVSHQTYAHKLITGRSLDNLRVLGGVSGFSKMSESEHDSFEAGHSSTSISAAIGFLEAKKTNKDIGHVISIIGDASITNGLSFEALNYLGAKKNQKAIIILNDNQMGVSKSVGSLALSFNKIRAKGSLKFLRKITPKGIKKMLKSFAYRQNIFEYLGFRYFEGIDGHNIKELIKYLSFAKESNKSVVLHIKTIKGKGYKFAEEDSSGYWHSVEPFNIDTGICKNENCFKSFGLAIANHLSEKIEDGLNNIRVITPAMTLGSGLKDFSVNYKDNFIDVGIAEENAVTMSSSMAIAGLRPFVFVYSTFLQRAYDEILHDVARPNLPVVFCIDRAGIIDGDGDTHQGIFDVSFLSTMPNVEILAPKNIIDAKKAVDYALKKSNPVAIRYAKKDENVNLFSESNFSKWDLIKDGDVLIISYGNLLSTIYETIKNTNVALCNAHNLSIIDKDLLLKYKKVIVIEEVIDALSLSNKIINYVYKEKIDIKVSSYNIGMNYLETGSKEDLLNKYIGDIASIIRKEAKC